MKSYRALLFDYGGTLDADGVTWLDRFLALSRRHAVAGPPEVLTRAFYDADDHLPSRHALTGLGLAETVRLQVRDAVLQASPSQAAAAEAMATSFVSDCREHFRRNRPVLERVARRYSLGIVSNFYGNLESVLASEGLRGFFGAVADSGVLGVEKPDAGIFRFAARGLNVPVEDCLMIGDSIKRDMRGAEALGMPHAWLRSGRGEPCCPRALVIETLSELEPFVMEAAAA